MEMTLHEKMEVLDKFLHPKDDYENTTNGFPYISLLQYSISYDWLMPVWAKFNGIQLDKDSWEDLCIKSLNVYIRNLLPDAPIQELFDLLVHGVLWYNSINPQQSAQII